MTSLNSKHVQVTRSRVSKHGTISVQTFHGISICRFSQRPKSLWLPMTSSRRVNLETTSPCKLNKNWSNGLTLLLDKRQILNYSHWVFIDVFHRTTCLSPSVLAGRSNRGRHTTHLISTDFNSFYISVAKFFKLNKKVVTFCPAQYISVELTRSRRYLVIPSIRTPMFISWHRFVKNTYFLQS